MPKAQMPPSTSDRTATPNPVTGLDHHGLSDPHGKMTNMRTNPARPVTDTGDLPTAGRRVRGTSKQKNWRRPAQMAVIALELDLSGDPRVCRRLEAHWSAVFKLRRATQRDAGGLCRAYLAARHERAA